MGESQVIVFYSGGSAIAETAIDSPAIMSSFYVYVDPDTNKPDSRLRRMLAIRTRENKGEKKCESKSKTKKLKIRIMKKSK